MQSINILVIEDDEAQRKIIEFNLSRAGYTTKGIGTINGAISLMHKFQFDLVVTDVMLPDGNGIDLLVKLLNINPNLIIIVITAFGTVRMAVEAIKKGAYDYLTKPFEKDELLFSVKQALKNKTDTQSIDISSILGVSPAIREIAKTVNRIADSNLPVLITGESGTGKEVIARAIHNSSNRRNKPFVAINCAAIPSDMLEAELFGYKKGAFTDAKIDKPGRFIIADKGTLFLDEIGSMDFILQPKILRVIETNTLEMLGDVESISFDTRIISATNMNLVELIKSGKFREDLYYRLNVIHIPIPPLRERKEDIPILIKHFIKMYSNLDNLVISNEAMNKIMDYPWYGNVRELQNFVRRVIALRVNDTITEKDVELNLNPIFYQPTSEYTLSERSMDEVEKEMIISALDKSGFNISKAAKLLKIPRYKLIYRMKKYRIGSQGNHDL